MVVLNFDCRLPSHCILIGRPCRQLFCFGPGLKQMAANDSFSRAAINPQAFAVDLQNAKVRPEQQKALAHSIEDRAAEAAHLNVAGSTWNPLFDAFIHRFAIVLVHRFQLSLRHPDQKRTDAAKRKFCTVRKRLTVQRYRAL